MVVLAIHGLGGGSYFFDELAARLAPDVHTIAVDLPVDPPRCSIENWTQELRRIAESIPEPVTLFGHSMGTILALEAWSSWPERIRSMVFVGGVPAVLPHIRERLSERVALLSNASDLRGWGRRVAAGVFSPSTFLDRPDVIGVFEERFEQQTIANYVRCCKVLLGANAEPIVPTVTVPCLAITGADDSYAPPEAVRAFVSRMPTPAQVEVIQECGHLPFLEQPERCAALVRAFLKLL
jgi:pimeloyl-ACP methyl ester carboxylesterase